MLRSASFSKFSKAFSRCNSSIFSTRPLSYVVVGDIEALDAIKESKSKKIFYFTASWCPPCRKIGRVYEILNHHHTLMSVIP